MNDVQWSPRATRQLLRIEARDRTAIYESAGGLVDFPACPNVKKLIDHRYQYLLRVGNYRVFFDFDGGPRIVHIEEVRKRDNRTY